MRFSVENPVVREKNISLTFLATRSRAGIQLLVKRKPMAMQTGWHLLSPKKNVDSTLAALAGCYVMYLLTKHSGIGISPDSVMYLSAARNFREGHGLIQFNHVPMVDFPLGYPVFLGIISFLSRFDPLAFAPVLNALLFAGTIYLAGASMNGFRVCPPVYKILVLSVLVLSPCLLEVYPMLWSETLFIFLLVIFLFVFTRYLQTHDTRMLWISAMVTALACVTRYAGVTLVGAGCALIILDLRSPAARRFRHFAGYALASMSLLVVNLVRNHYAYGYLAGIRQRGVTPFRDNLYYFGSVLCEWLPLPREHRFFSIFTACLVILLMALIFFSELVRRDGELSFEAVATGYALVYAVFIIVSATVSRYQQLNSRLLSPLFIPLLWSLSFRIPILVGLVKGRGRWLAAGLALLLAAALQYHQLTADYEMYDGVRDAGVPGYTEDPFPQSQIVGYIKAHAAEFRPAYRVYSNAADAYYFFTGRPADLLPELAFPDRVNRFYGEKYFYLVWFNDVDNPDEPGLEDILRKRNLTPLAKFPDGTVWIANSDGS